MASMVGKLFLSCTVMESLEGSGGLRNVGFDECDSVNESGEVN